MLGWKFIGHTGSVSIALVSIGASGLFDSFNGIECICVMGSYPPTLHESTDICLIVSVCEGSGACC